MVMLVLPAARNGSRASMERFLPADRAFDDRQTSSPAALQGDDAVGLTSAMPALSGARREA
jgi:hypothetical protein